MTGFCLNLMIWVKILSLFWIIHVSVETIETLRLTQKMVCLLNEIILSVPNLSFTPATTIE